MLFPGSEKLLFTFPASQNLNLNIQAWASGSTQKYGSFYVFVKLQVIKQKI